MKLIKIKPSKIKVPEIRVTSVMSEEKQQLLRDFLKGQGVIAPIVVQEIGGEIYLVDGKHRVDELLAAGDQLVDAAVIEGDMVDLLTRNLFLDHIRGDHQVGDMIKVLRELSEVHNLDVVAIEERTGLTRSYIEKILNISKASRAVLEALDQGIIGVGHAAEIVRLPSEIQQEEIVAKQSLYKFPVKELKGFIDDVLKAMDEMAKKPVSVVEPAKVQVRKYSCEGCKVEAEPRYLRPVFLCPDCFGTVWKLGKNALAQSLEEDQDNGGV